MDSAGEEEVIISCAKCGTTPDDVLILTCDHNLCLICAAKNLRREQAKTKHSFQVYIYIYIYIYIDSNMRHLWEPNGARPNISKRTTSNGPRIIPSSKGEYRGDGPLYLQY